MPSQSISQPPRSPWGARMRARSATVARDRARSRRPSACPAPAPQPRATYSPTSDGPKITAFALPPPFHDSRTCLELDSCMQEWVMNEYVEPKPPALCPHRAHSPTSCSRQLDDDDPVAPNRRGATKLRKEIKQRLGGSDQWGRCGSSWRQGGPNPFGFASGGPSNHRFRL